ncbi:hypothetical protein TIFTF001_032559 [Ficus carica]|uniref:Uncharacterized protein n=1 Tax=Ficus carica TaxID=3494 RepID=A0AA88DWU7_FICCA|nr:hypothetical protein TIFTF001_032559 [Ficus carica]
MQSFVSWLTSLWKLQYLFWFLQVQSVLIGRGPRAVPSKRSGSTHVPLSGPREFIDGTFRQEFWALIHNVSPIEKFRPLMYSSASVCFWVVPVKCTKVFFFRVFALRNAAEMALDNYLNEPIIPGISLRIRGAIIRGYGRHLKSSCVRHNHDCGGEIRIDQFDLLQYVPLTHQQVELLLEVVQFALVIRLDLWCFIDRAISTSATIDPCSSHAVEHRGRVIGDDQHVLSVLILCSVWIVLFEISSPSSRVPRVLRLPVCSTIGPRLLELLADRHRPASEESSASSSSVGWGRAPRNSLKASLSTRTVSVQFWTFSVKISVYVGFHGACAPRLHWAH